MLLLGTELADAIAGTTRADAILGLGGDDLLAGRGGADSLSGGGGDDTLLGGAGDDSLDGGEGWDVVSYADATGGVTVNLHAGASAGAAGADLLANFEAVQGSPFADLLLGVNGGAETLQGGAGNDTLYGGAGDDSLHGGVGEDWAFYGNAAQAIVANLAGGTVAGGDGSDTVSDLEGIVATAFADVLTGDARDNFFRGNAGNDTLDGAGGSDWADYAAAPGPVAVDVALGAMGADGTDVFTGIENAAGGGFDDVLVGDGSANVLRGNAGNDSLFGGGGADTADYRDASGPVTVTLGLGTATGADGNDTLTGIEHIAGSAQYGDQLRGDDGANFIEGRGGNDVVDGGPGFDIAVFAGSFRSYRVLVEVGNFELIVIGPDGVDRLNNVEVLKFDDRHFVVRQGGAQAEQLAGNDEGDLIRGREGNDQVQGAGGDDALYGDDGTDTLEGGTGDDWLDGGTGADTLAGGAGDDVYVVDSADDVIQESGLPAGSAKPSGDAGPLAVDPGSNVDTVIASIDYTLSSLLENLVLATGAGSLEGTGNAGANEIEGNEAANTLEGGAGNDTITGGDGVDVASYSGQRSEYEVLASDTAFTVQGPEGIDLVDVERLRFADMGVALDLDGHAGEVAKILGVLFGASSLAERSWVGLGLAATDGGMAYEELMQAVIDLAYPGISHGDFVTLMYMNLVGVEPDAESLALYAGMLEDGVLTQATLAVLAADTEYNLANIGYEGLAAGGLEFI